MTGPRSLTNWAGNVTFRPRALHRPSSLAELCDLIARSRQVRVLGTGHSFNGLADTPGELVSLASLISLGDLPVEPELDADRREVRVGAATRYGELATWLHARGWALENLGSLPHISVAGAVATGTHGSGVGNANLASAVVALELVTADGGRVTVGRADSPAWFPGAVVALGALGVVVRLTLAVVPAYDVQQLVYDDLPHRTLPETVAEVLASGYSVSVFTRWARDGGDAVWWKGRVGADRPPVSGWLGTRPADGARHPIPGLPVEHCTEQLGVPGPWHARLPHFRLEFTPSSGEELQSEFFVPRALAADALRAVDRLADRVTPVLQVSEIRAVARDDLWLSPCFARDSVALHFTWVRDEAVVRPVVAAVEAVLREYGARPHWGKVFTERPDVVRSAYPKFAEFAALARELDPSGKFCNAFLVPYLRGAG